MKRIFILIGFCLVFYTHSQEDLKEGFIIQNNGDTVKGLIDFRSIEENNLKCTFKSKDGLIANYKPFEILAYRITNDRFFISKEVEFKGVKKSLFLECLVKGKISLCFAKTDEGKNYFIQKEGESKIVLLQYSKEVLFDEKKGYYNKIDNKYKGVLISYMQDAPTLFNRIKEITEPEHDILIQLIEDYHNIVCNDYQCQVYRKIENPVYRLNLSLNFCYGFFFSRSFRDNEKWNYCFGFSSNLFDLKKLDDFGRLYKIFLGVKYIYPRVLVKPTFNFGVNLYTDFSEYLPLFNIGTGFQIDLGEKIGFFAQVDIDYLSEYGMIPIRPEVIIYPTIGLSYKF